MKSTQRIRYFLPPEPKRYGDDGLGEFWGFVLSVKHGIVEFETATKARYSVPLKDVRCEVRSRLATELGWFSRELHRLYPGCAFREVTP